MCVDFFINKNSIQKINVTVIVLNLTSKYYSEGVSFAHLCSFSHCYINF